MCYYKNKILLLIFFIGFLYGGLISQQSNDIYYSTVLDRDSFQLNFIIFKKNVDTNVLRILVKVRPIYEESKQVIENNKTHIMFEKRKMLEIIANRKEMKYANDYIYEEGYGYFYLIFTFLDLDFKNVSSLGISDSLFTNSKKIILI